MGLRDRLKPAFLRYAFGGLTRRLSQAFQCPQCGQNRAAFLDRKLFHGIYHCAGCALRFRYPYETAAESAHFYQQDYSEASIVQDAHDSALIAQIKQKGFAGTDYDRSHNVRAFSALAQMQPGQRVLDFGANWGYTVQQLQDAGFAASGFELSTQRAALGKSLGLEILTREDDIPQNLDVIVSNHVIEHVPRPANTLQMMYARLRPGGYLIAYTPNGDEAYRRKNPAGFHAVWGRAHPVLLTSDFVTKLFPDQAIFVSSNDDTQSLARWQGTSRLIDICDGYGLLFCVRKPQIQ
jgi:SAM-dependent methyltransferase